jgi:phosphocarrier protein FPr
VTTITVANPHGLHARRRLGSMQTASSFDVLVQVRDLTNGRGPADAKSLNAIATLGAASGHELEIAATGPQGRGDRCPAASLASRNSTRRSRPPEPPSPLPSSPGHR